MQVPGVAHRPRGDRKPSEESVNDVSSPSLSKAAEMRSALWKSFHSNCQRPKTKACGLKGDGPGVGWG